MILKKIILTAGILSLMAHLNLSYAQEIGCEERYQIALAQYNLGMVDSALNILEPCLMIKQIHKDLTRGESANIYRLAALSSIIIGNPEDAERYIKEMLKYKPDYAGNWREGDLMEFRYMVEGTTSQPSFNLGIWGGVNFPLLGLQKNYTDPEKPDATFALEGKTGFQFGIFSEIAISRNLALKSGIGLLHVKFDYQVQDNQAENYLYNQEITYIEIPILVKYYIPLNGALKPYFQAGVSGKFSFYQRENSEEYGKYWFTESSDSDNILATFVTDLENLGIAVGGGVSYNLKTISIGLDMRYAHHINSKKKLEKFDDIQGYENISSKERFSYTNDINLITLSDLQISLILSYNLKYKVF